MPVSACALWSSRSSIWFSTAWLRRLLRKKWRSEFTVKKIPDSFIYKIPADVRIRNKYKNSRFEIIPSWEFPAFRRTSSPGVLYFVFQACKLSVITSDSSFMLSVTKKQTTSMRFINLLVLFLSNHARQRFDFLNFTSPLARFLELIACRKWWIKGFLTQQSSGYFIRTRPKPLFTLRIIIWAAILRLAAKKLQQGQWLWTAMYPTIRLHTYSSAADAVMERLDRRFVDISLLLDLCGRRNMIISRWNKGLLTTC